MRPVLAALLLVLTAAFAQAEGNPPDINPAASVDRNEARWADWEAQSRITEGDYDGAAQAQKQADAARRNVNPREMPAQSTKR